MRELSHLLDVFADIRADEEALEYENHKRWIRLRRLFDVRSYFQGKVANTQEFGPKPRVRQLKPKLSQSHRQYLTVIFLDYLMCILFITQLPYCRKTPKNSAPFQRLTRANRRENRIACLQILLFRNPNVWCMTFSKVWEIPTSRQRSRLAPVPR